LNFLRVLGALVRKDFEDAFRNQTVWLALLVPVILATVMHQVSKPQDARRPLVGIVAGADSGLARNLEQKEALKVQRLGTIEDGLRSLDAHKLVVLIQCGPDFDRELRGGSFPRVSLTVDSTRPTQVAIVRYVLDASLREQAGQDIPADIAVVNQRGGKGLFQESFVAAWILFSTLSALGISASSVGEEKEAGTLQQITQSPATTSEILLGKAVVGFALALASASLIFALNASPSASWLRALVLMGTGAIAFSLMGVAIGLLAEGPTAINAWTGLVFIGLFVPAALAETSEMMSKIAAWSPAFYFQDGLIQALLGRRELASLTASYGSLVIVAVLATWVGARRLRNLSN
jgi:ABC-type Na+ efflux pump permease subunit